MSNVDLRSGPHIVTLDVCLAGVFVAQGERIPDDLYDAWLRRLSSLGLDTKQTSARPLEPAK